MFRLAFEGEYAYRGAQVLRYYQDDTKIGYAHLEDWSTKPRPKEVQDLLRGEGSRYGILCIGYIAVNLPQQGYGVLLLAELARYAGRRGCVLTSSSLFVPGFDNAAMLKTWRTLRTRSQNDLRVGDRCAVLLKGEKIP